MERQLVDILASLYDTSWRIEDLLPRSFARIQDYDLRGSALDVWARIAPGLWEQQLLPRVVERAASEFPDEQEQLSKALHEFLSEMDERRQHSGPDLWDSPTQDFALTRGLLGIPGDPLTGLQSFLREYLGTPDQRKPFGGRSAQLEDLDSWLDDTSRPITLIAEPAGRGKSALLVRWCDSLVRRSKADVAFIPVSIRVG